MASDIAWFLKNNQDNLTKSNENDLPKKRLDPEIFRMLPKLKSSTKIVKLGSKKSGYVNESIDMKTFLTELESTYKMNYPDSEYFFESNMIITISSHCINIADWCRVTFTAECSKFEYKLNKAATKRVIKKKKIEEPVVLRSLSV